MERTKIFPDHLQARDVITPIMADTFVALFSNEDEWDLFLHKLNSLYLSLRFTFDKES